MVNAGVPGSDLVIGDLLTRAQAGTLTRHFQLSPETARTMH